MSGRFQSVKVVSPDRPFLSVEQPAVCLFANLCTDRPYLPRAISTRAGHSPAMLTEIYIETLLIDKELAEQVWQAWDYGSLTDSAACVV